MHYSFINAFRRVRRRVRFVRPHSPLLVRGQATVLTLLALDIRYSVFQWFERLIWLFSTVHSGLYTCNIFRRCSFSVYIFHHYTGGMGAE